jgi:hypothetical protein
MQRAFENYISRVLRLFGSYTRIYLQSTVIISVYQLLQNRDRQVSQQDTQLCPLRLSYQSVENGSRLNEGTKSQNQIWILPSAYSKKILRKKNRSSAWDMTPAGKSFPHCHSTRAAHFVYKYY